jgi:hypothetical protein
MGLKLHDKTPRSFRRYQRLQFRIHSFRQGQKFRGTFRFLSLSYDFRPLLHFGILSTRRTLAKPRVLFPGEFPERAKRQLLVTSNGGEAV